MKEKPNLAQPIIDFMHFFIHIHQLNGVFAHSIEFYEKRIEALINANKVLSKYAPEEEWESEDEVKEKQKKIIKAVRKEIADNFYSVKTGELILLYSRFEAAITEVVYVFFQTTKAAAYPDVDNAKSNLKVFMALNARNQKTYIADLYIQQKSANIKYGFQRFEAILEPLFGKSVIDERIKNDIFKFAQLRNLLIHKNGIVDSQFKNIFKESKCVLGKRLNITANLMNLCINSIVVYADEIVERIKARQA